MRDDDQRRLRRPSPFEPGAQQRRAPEKQAGLESDGSRISRDLNAVSERGPRTGADALMAFTQGVAQERDPVLETEAHVRKARELLAAIQARPSAERDQALRAELIHHLEHAESHVARCAQQPAARDAIAAYDQLRVDVEAELDRHEAQRADPVAVAGRGVEGRGQALPHRDQIQRAFGPHDVSGIEAHVGGAAADASRTLGAQAYAHGNSVAFGSDPSLFVAAHEAAHVVQQRAGVSLKAIDGGGNDPFERHADDVAGAVVRGESAAPLLAQLPSGGAGSARAVQRKGEGASTTAEVTHAPKTGGKELYLSVNANHLWVAVGDYLQRINFPVPDPRLQWRNEQLFTAQLVQALRGAIDLTDRSQLLGVLYPAQPFGALDGLVPLNKQGAPLDLTWSPTVGHAIAPLFVDAVVASLQRLGPRWVAAAEHSPQRDGQLDEKKSLVSFEALVKSAPMDISVARALTSAAVVELTGNEKPKTEKPRPLRGINSFQWQGPKLWNWIKVTDPADVTAEDVAATLLAHRGSKKDGPTTYYAYGITAAPPLFGIPPTWAIEFDDAKRYAPAKVSEGSQEQRLLQVASSDHADELAVAQASHESGSNKHASVEQLRATLGDCATQLNFLVSSLAKFKLDAPVTNALRWVLVRQTELASATPEDAAKWESAIVQQKKHLTTIVAGVQQVTSTGNSEAEPIKRVLSTYAHAAGVSFMAASCEQLVASALAQQGSLALQGVRGAATELQESVGQYEQATGHSLDPKRFDNPADLVERCNEMQSQMLAGKQVDGGALETTLLQTQEVTLQAKIDGLRAQLRQLREQAAAIGDGALSTIIAQFHGSFRSVPDAADSLEGDLAAVEQVWHADARFASVTMAGQDHDDNMRAMRRKLLDAAQQRFTQIAGNGNSKISTFLRDAASALQSQAKYVQIAATCIQLLAMLGVSFVASAAGSAVSRFVGGLLLRGGGAELAEMSLGARALAAAGRMATFGAGVATEAGVNVAGQHALGQKEEGTSLSTEMLENMIMIGGAQAILGRIGHELEFAQQLEKEAGVTWKTNAKAMIAAETATITTHAVLNIALSYVAHQVTTAAGLRKESERAIASNSVQLNDWFMQGLSVGLGRLVHSRFAPRVAMYKKLAELPQLPQARLLPARAESLLNIARTPESMPSGELLPPLMAKPRDLLTDEKQVLDELARNPDARRAAGMSDNDVAAARHRNAADGADMYVPGSESIPLMNAGLEDLGAGKLWAGTSEQIHAAIEGAGQSKLDVHDTNSNGIHKLTIEGKVFEIHERAKPAPQAHEAVKPSEPGVASEGAKPDANWKHARDEILSGKVPSAALLPDTQGNRDGLQRLADIHADESIPAAVRDEFMRDFALRLQAEQTPPQDLLWMMKSIVYTKEGSAKYQRKGTKIPNIAYVRDVLGGLRRMVPLQSLCQSGTLSPEFYQRLRDDHPGLPEYAKLTWSNGAVEVVKLINSGTVDFDPYRDLLPSAIIQGRGEGDSGWYFAGADADVSDVKSAQTQLAVSGVYLDGYVVMDLPAERALPDPATGHAGASRPTALDLTLAPEGKLNPDKSEPVGRTNPQAPGQRSAREVVMPPMPISAMSKRTLVRGGGGQ